MRATLYEPINVYKPVAPNIGIVDGPFEYLTVGGVRLLLHSPTKFDAGLAQALQEMGAVRHLISPNQFHYAHTGEWQEAFPDAITWASPGVRERARARRTRVGFTRDLGASPPHRASRTLILTDAIINLELKKIDEPWRTVTRLGGMYHPRGAMFFGMRLPFLLQRKRAKAAVGKIRSWRPQRILLSHGRCFESGADEVISSVFGAPQL